MRFIITFGSADILRCHSYTVVHAEDAAAATEEGYRLYGNEWSRAYPEPEGYDIVQRWGLTYISPGS